MANCEQCGSPMKDGATFCGKCGARAGAAQPAPGAAAQPQNAAPNAQPTPPVGAPVSPAGGQAGQQPPAGNAAYSQTYASNVPPQMNMNANPMTATTREGIKERNIGLYIFLSIITCGIFMLVWYYKVVEETNKLGNSNEPSPVFALLFSIITCNLYNVYVYYTMPDKIFYAHKIRGMGEMDENSRVFKLLMALLYFFDIPVIIMQSEINKIARYDSGMM